MSSLQSALYSRLIRLAQAWPLDERFDADEAQALRRKAILANHAHYLECIPVYRRFAEGEEIGPQTTIELIPKRLMFPVDIFKRYNQPGWMREISRA